MYASHFDHIHPLTPPPLHPLYQLPASYLLFNFYKPWNLICVAHMYMGVGHFKIFSVVYIFSHFLVKARCKENLEISLWNIFLLPWSFRFLKALFHCFWRPGPALERWLVTLCHGTSYNCSPREAKSEIANQASLDSTANSRPAWALASLCLSKQTSKYTEKEVGLWTRQRCLLPGLTSSWVWSPRATPWSRRERTLEHCS